MEQVPAPIEYKEVNLQNHMQAIKFDNLGPADPRQVNTLYWGDRMVEWNVPEGVARTRLCMNCDEYDNSVENQIFMTTNADKLLKASELPVSPKWADIDGMPAAICKRWNITCSALRTCSSWEPIEEEDGTD